MSKTKCQILRTLSAEIPCCRLCPRLVAYREQIASVKKREYRDCEYWGKPVPGYGDPLARVLVVGLAPAAHGANRTGRMFTGDSSAAFLLRAMHEHGFAVLPTSRHRDDGQRLRGAYITAVVRCAPPDNKPSPEETRNCLPYLERELRALAEVRLLLLLGKFAWDGVWNALRSLGTDLPNPRPRFGHGVECSLGHPFRQGESLTLLASYHPSRQNTNTGKLTQEMLSEVFERARRRVEE